MERTFEQLQVDILSAVETIYLKKNQLILHLPYWWHVFQRVMAAGVITAFAIGAFVLIWPLSPNAWTRLNWFLGGLFPGQVGNLFFIALFVGIVIGIVIVLPVFLISGVRFAKLREMLWIVYFVGFMPSGFGAGQWFLQDLFLGSADIVSVITYWSVLANMFSYLITMLIVLVSSGVSYIFFFVLGRPIHREQRSFIPSFDQIVFRVIEQVKDKDTIKDLHLDQINALQGMAQRKHASLGVQSQTVASLVATFSLFGLVALFFTQEDLRSLLALIEQWLGDEFRGSLVWIVLPVLLAIAIFPLRYFFRILVALRVLDIMVELLEIRSKELQTAPATEGGFVLQKGIYVPQQGRRRNRR